MEEQQETRITTTDELVSASRNGKLLIRGNYGLPKRLGSKRKLIGSHMHSMVKGRFGHHFASSLTLCSWLSWYAARWNLHIDLHGQAGSTENVIESVCWYKNDLLPAKLSLYQSGSVTMFAHGYRNINGFAGISSWAFQDPVLPHESSLSKLVENTENGCFVP